MFDMAGFLFNWFLNWVYGHAYINLKWFTIMFFEESSKEIKLLIIIESAENSNIFFGMTKYDGVESNVR